MITTHNSTIAKWAIQINYHTSALKSSDLQYLLHFKWSLLYIKETDFMPQIPPDHDANDQGKWHTDS